ncbi:hypothetical protein [Pseudogulbenkiania sp. MAI-1]|uniref:hypothetical protein n=1 Tax=Pseudogulbenkiania sp. MAI-1 TaxID=990370 RepID=UPI00045EB323|nr:hypothetical protein [Pseudogulbenkiania sp. MAI-1]
MKQPVYWVCAVIAAAVAVGMFYFYGFSLLTLALALVLLSCPVVVWMTLRLAKRSEDEIAGTVSKEHEGGRKA